MSAWLVSDTQSSCVAPLDLFHCDGAHRADLYTGFAPKAVILPGWYGLAVFKVIDLSWAGVYALFIALTFVVINGDLEHIFLLVVFCL